MLIYIHLINPTRYAPGTNNDIPIPRIIVVNTDINPNSAKVLMRSSSGDTEQLIVASIE